MKALAIAALALVLPVGVQAQDFWSNTLPTITGNDALGTTLREKEAQGEMTRSTPPAASGAGGCSIDALTASEKQELYAKYVEVRREKGQAAADAWTKAMGPAIRNRLTALGRC